MTPGELAHDGSPFVRVFDLLLVLGGGLHLTLIGPDVPRRSLRSRGVDEVVGERADRRTDIEQGRVRGQREVVASDVGERAGREAGYAGSARAAPRVGVGVVIQRQAAR